MGVSQLRIAPGEGSDRVTVLLVSTSQTDYSSLRDILSHSNWSLMWAQTAADAERTVTSLRIPVVILGAEPEGADWNRLRDSLLALPLPPNILASVRFSDASRWISVIDSGVYDVLPRPYDPGEVFQVVGFAWLQWKRAMECQDFEHKSPAKAGAPEFQVAASQ